jgi:hypothetical protein
MLAASAPSSAPQIRGCTSNAEKRLNDYIRL